MFKEATKYFDNISIDLIYGVPEWVMKMAKNRQALSFGIPHISSYALTEPKTALKN
jgi:oxygen-independent coproporphyrinogen-3 oxidase